MPLPALTSASGAPLVPEAGVVFDVHPYAVHDGPGIRTVVFLKGCPLACSWCCNPESQHGGPEVMHSAWRCGACGRCAKACEGIEASGPAPVLPRRQCDVCEARTCMDACPEAALRVSGRAMNPGTVLDLVLKDRPFFLNSGGGVTFSGGEPLAQPDFLEALLQGCREAGVHTAVETCGHADPGLFERLDPLVDLWLFDLKLVDRDAHLAHTGVDNAWILANLAWLAGRRPGDVVVRLPLIPGITDGEENLQAIAATMQRLGLRRLDLEPFHLLGLDKYAGLGRDYRGPQDGEAFPASRVAALQARFEALGLEVEVM